MDKLVLSSIVWKLSTGILNYLFKNKVFLEGISSKMVLLYCFRNVGIL